MRQLRSVRLGPFTVEPFERFRDPCVEAARRVSESSSSSVAWINACVNWYRPAAPGGSSST